MSVTSRDSFKWSCVEPRGEARPNPELGEDTTKHETEWFFKIRKKKKKNSKKTVRWSIAQERSRREIKFKVGLKACGSHATGGGGAGSSGRDTVAWSTLAENFPFRVEGTLQHLRCGSVSPGHCGCVPEGLRKTTGSKELWTQTQVREYLGTFLHNVQFSGIGKSTPTLPTAPAVPV